MVVEWGLIFCKSIKHPREAEAGGGEGRGGHCNSHYCFLLLVKPVAITGRGRVGDARKGKQSFGWTWGFILRRGRVNHVYRLKKNSQ